MIQGRNVMAGVLGVVCAITILGLIGLSQGAVFSPNFASSTIPSLINANVTATITVSSSTPMIATVNTNHPPASAVTSETSGAQNSTQSVSSFTYTQSAASRTKTGYSSTAIVPPPTAGVSSSPAFQKLGLGSNSSQMIQNPAALLEAALLGGISIVLALGVFFIISRRIK